MKFGRLTESVPFHQTSGADKCGCVCMNVCIRDRLGYICHLAVLPQTQRYPALCVESEPPDHGSRSLHVLNITKNKHTCSTKAQMLWGNTLIAVCGCQSNPHPTHYYLFFSSFLWSILSFLQHGRRTPHPPHWGRLRPVWEFLETFIRLQRTLKRKIFSTR